MMDVDTIPDITIYDIAEGRACDQLVPRSMQKFDMGIIQAIKTSKCVNCEQALLGFRPIVFSYDWDTGRVWWWHKERCDVQVKKVFNNLGITTVDIVGKPVNNLV